MSDDDTPSGPTEDFGSLLGRNIGGLLILSMWQTRALMALSSAIELDSSVSEPTRKAAKEASKLVEKMVSEIEKLSNGAVKLGKEVNGE